MKVSLFDKTNFRGLFTDKSKEYAGNWRIEYSPYSWEKRMAPKIKLDIFSSYLPENEEIFIQEGEREYSQDIFGTVSYYKYTIDGKDVIGRTITEMPQMNLEDSLKVKKKKLEIFLGKKQAYMNQLKKDLSKRMILMFDISHEHNKYASDINRDIFSHVYSKIDRAKGVKQNFDKMTSLAEENGKDFQKYIQLSESYKNVLKELNSIKTELMEIELAKMTNSLIDISRRDIPDCNKPLTDALKNLSNIEEKIIALSNKTITVKEILHAIGNNKNAKNIMKYVENIMKR